MIQVLAVEKVTGDALIPSVAIPISHGDNSAIDVTNRNQPMLVDLAVVILVRFYSFENSPHFAVFEIFTSFRKCSLLMASFCF